MNSSIYNIGPFSNVSKSVFYNIYINERPPLQLFAPLVNYLQDYLYRHLSKSPDFIIPQLQEHHGLLSADTIRKGWVATLLPMLLGYVFILAGLGVLAVFPIVLYMRIGSKKSINISKYQMCFCVEGFMFIIASVFLAFSTAGSIQAAVGVDESLDFYPALAASAVDDILTFHDNLKVQLDILRHDLYIVLELKLLGLVELPNRIAYTTKEMLHPTIPNLQIQFTEFYKNYKKAINNSGLITAKNGTVNHSIEFAIAEVKHNMEDVRSYLQKLKNKVQADESLDLSEKEDLTLKISFIMKKASIDFKNVEVLNWMLISSYLNEVDLNLLPSTNDSVFFIKTIPNKTQQELEPIISSMEKKIQHLQKWANQSLETIDSIVDRFVSRKKLLQFKDTMENFMEKANNLNIPSQNSWFSGRALLLLLPGFHGLTVLFIMIIASVVGIHEIRRLNDGCKLEPQFKNSYGAKVIRCGVVLGLILLWLHLLLAGIIYIASIVVTVFCLPVMDFTVFYRYLDNIKVWDNKTWVDSVIQEFATNYSERIWFMQLLENCENNNTLYEALHMENYWNIEQYMQLETLKLEKQSVINAIDTAMKNVQLPNMVLMQIMIIKLSYVSEYLQLNFTKELVHEIMKFHYNKLTTSEIEPILKNLPEEPRYEYFRDDLRIILYEIKKIEDRSMTYVLQNVSMLANLKENVIKCKEELPKLVPQMSQIHQIMKQALHPVLHELISSTLATTDNLLYHFQLHAKRSVKNDVGNCHLLYSLFKKVSWAICNNGHDLLIGVWLSLGLMGVSMSITILLGCRISSYFRGAHRSHFRWQQRLHTHKSNDTTMLKSDALLFDDRGEFLGNAVMVPVPDQREIKPFSPFSTEATVLFKK